MDKIIQKVADKYGTTPEQVRADISCMINEAIKNRNNSPESQALWKELSPNGELPSVEEFLLFVTTKAKNGCDSKKRRF